MLRFEGELREYKAGTQRHGETCDRQTPQGTTGTWVQVDDSKRREQTGTGTAADTGMRSGERGQAAEASGRRVRSVTRWAALCTGRGGGERVKIERASKRNGYEWGRGSK